MLPFINIIWHSGGISSRRDFNCSDILKRVVAEIHQKVCFLINTMLGLHNLSQSMQTPQVTEGTPVKKFQYQ